jgi:hypothetical protein
MPQSEARAWWADVQDVRESIERRRALTGAADSSVPVDVSIERRFARRAAESLAQVDDLDATSAASRSGGGRFDRADDPDRGEPARPRSRRPVGERGGGGGSMRDRGDVARLASTGTDDAYALTATDAHEPIAFAATSTGPGATSALAPPPARRTVRITGRTVASPPLPRLVEVERRRPARRPAERVGPRPDRIALWAVLLGFFLILVAATSSNAAVHPAHAADAAAVALHAPAR